MASIFPADPDIGDVFESYRWDGTAWMVIGVDFTTDYASYSQLSSHEADSTNVHAITDTSTLETQTGAQSKATTALNSANSYTDTKVPAQTGNSGKFLTTNGSATSWGTVELTTKADVNSPTFTGTPAAPTASSGTSTTQIATTSFVQNAVKVVSINAQTASYTLVLTDLGSLVSMNVGSANNLTVPPNSSVAFAIGSQINVVQWGTGQTTIVAGVGVSLASTPGNKLRAQYSVVTLVKIDTNTWLVMGDTSA